MSRWFRFILVILVGIALGVLYGWVINPVEFVDTSPDMLRIDYQTDIALMAAEAYSLDGDLELAARRLALEPGVEPREMLARAIAFGERPDVGYHEDDLKIMQALYEDLADFEPDRETGAP